MLNFPMSFFDLLKKFLPVVLFLALHLVPAEVFASFPGRAGFVPLELKKGQDRSFAGLYAEYLEDSSRSLTIDTILSRRSDAKFQPLGSKVKNIGYTDSAYWIRFPVRNSEGEKTEWWLNTLPVWINVIDIYIIHKKHIVHKRGGVNFPFSHREIKVNDLIFPLYLDARETVWIYIRVFTVSSQLNISVWSPERYLENYYLYQVLNGLYFGLIFVMAVYNFMIFLSIRDRSYLYYTIYLVAMGLFLMSMTGYGFAYLWPNLTEIGITISRIFSSLYLIAAILQAINFLQLKRNFYRSYIFLLVLIAAPLCVIILFFIPSVRARAFLPAWSAVNATVITSVIFILSLRAFIRGYRPARYYTLAWIFPLIGIVVFVLKQFAVIPESILVEYSIHVGTTFEVAFISLALTHRIRLLRKEKEAAQKNALDAQRVLMEELEEKVRERTESLQQSETRFRALADATFEGIIICRQRKIIDCNFTLLDLSGHTWQELAGKTVTGLFLARDNDLFRKIFRSGLNHPVEILMKTKKGTFIPVEILGKNISQGGKKILIIAVRDIRERKKTLRMKENVERVIRHDLKTPLSSIIEFSNLLISRENKLSDKKQKNFSRIILENSLRMNEMLNQSLDFFKMEEGIYNISPREVDLGALLRRIDRSFSRLKKIFCVEMEIFIEGEKLTGAGKYLVMGEENKLYNLFSNLIKNAIEASPPGEKVTVYLSRGRSFHNIRIHNRGKIPGEIKGRLFEPYVTGGKPGGTGLGIYSARMIAVSHKGEITFTSSKKRGTAFTVKLPVRF